MCVRVRAGHYSINSFYSEENPHFCVPPSKHSDESSTCDTSKKRMSSTLVIGALQFVGAGLVSHLASLGRDVRALASYESVLQSGELAWYRDQQLRAHHGVTVTLTNLTNSTHVWQILESRKPSDIVFVAPGLGGELTHGGMDTAEIDGVMSQSLEELMLFLENAREALPCARVVLISHNKLQTNPVRSNHQWMVYLAWLRTLELAVSTYHNLYRVPIEILRFNGVHGPWSEALLDRLRRRNSLEDISHDYCWYIEEVVAYAVESMQQTGNCLVSELEPCSVKRRRLLANPQSPTAKNNAETLDKSFLWAREHVSKKGGNFPPRGVVFVSYLTSTREYTNKQFLHMEEFYWSLKKHGLEAVIFHKDLDTGFQHRLSSDHPKLSFSRVESLHNRSTNDARFYSYYQYLREHPDIDKVLLMESLDVEFQKDPFQLMFLLGDWLYVGTDADLYPNMKAMSWLKERLGECFIFHSMDTRELNRVLMLDTVYDSGTIGGSRETVLDLLAVVLAYLDSAPTGLNCNMPSLNYAVHEHFFDKVFTGFPLTKQFLHQH